MPPVAQYFSACSLVDAAIALFIIAVMITGWFAEQLVYRSLSVRIHHDRTARSGWNGRL